MGNDKITINNFFRKLDFNKATTTEINYSNLTAIIENGVFQAILKIIDEKIIIEIFIFDNRLDIPKKISLYKYNLKIFVNKDLVNGMLFELSSIEELYFKSLYLNKNMILKLVKVLDVDLEMFIKEVEDDYSNIRLYNFE